MPNPYFQFKQFTIHHDQCAMKVCTDACILGAWFAEKIIPNSRVLDIGAGSGLLTLMLAQKAKAQFDAIEKDAQSFKQMTENIAQSQWKDTINVVMGDAITYAFPQPYDFIICNPPFYENDLKSGDEKKDLAKHDTGLTLETLAEVVDQNLADDGSFGVLLPFHRTVRFEQLALDKKFYLSERLFVRQTPRHDYFRSILHFTRHKRGAFREHELIIKQNDDSYSNAFTELLKDYYLYL